MWWVVVLPPYLTVEAPTTLQDMAPAASASTLLSDVRQSIRLSVGCPQLDAALGGGLDMTGITEIAGEAGSAKTQLALQLMLQAQLPQQDGGLSGGAIYLHGDTASCEGAMRRLDTLAEAYAAKYAAIGCTADLLKNQIYIMPIDSPEDLWKVVDQSVPQFLGERCIRLLVLDSIGGVYRTSAEEAVAAATATGSEVPAGTIRAAAHGERAQHAMHLAARLKQLGAQYNLAVVIINQVSDKPIDEDRRRSCAPWELGVSGGSDRTATAVKVPALGAAWSCCVNTRLVLTRTVIPGGGDGEHAVARGGSSSSCWRRRLHIAWSPRCEEMSVPFEVHDSGLRGLYLHNMYNMYM